MDDLRDTIPPGANLCSPENMREANEEIRELSRRQVALLNELLGVISRKGLLEKRMAECWYQLYGKNQ